MLRSHPTFRLLTALVVAALTTTACFEFSSATEPTASASIIKALSTGTWASNGSINKDSCGNFTWSIAELTATTAKGTFGATCFGSVDLKGNADGVLSGDVLTWKADGVATTSGVECSFTLNGTATLEGAYVRVNYTANTCVGTFSGSELLKK